jgi:uncharacterized repeat protein (TIGR04042 family)
MPEMTFLLEWPDGQRQSCYSPSLVMHDYLTSGSSYSVTEFLALVETALTEASERVRAKYGTYCTSAIQQLAEIREAAEGVDGTVRVLSMTPPLPVQQGAVK